MARAWMSLIVLLGAWALAQTLVSTPAEAQLDPYFYSETCPGVNRIVAETMLDAIANDSRISASLLRVHFHDCFVLGCDASVLLNGDFSERTNVPNLGSLRGFDTLDAIKAALEAECPGVVSCADVVALASFYGVILSGGPIWVIPLGRRDGNRVSNANDTIGNLPPASSNLTGLSTLFSSKNLSLTDLVALSGGHTIGDSRCVSFTITTPINDDRLYNFNNTNATDPTLNSTYAAQLEAICPQGGDGNVTTPMDNKTNGTFDNSYFKNFLTNEQLFISDNALFNDNGNASEADTRNITKQLVLNYASNQSLFFDDFVAGMIRMGNLNVTTGTDGEIRTNCSVLNPTSSSSGLLHEKPRSESKPPRELSAEEKQKYIEGIRDVVERAKYAWWAKHLQLIVDASEEVGYLM